eukprot:CAMPEP_0168774636 /NCGR_PEP_ID=MMETSP0725-20121227/5099_1 /TAXON_ID=265536 /ORGANISM="Amphiprora sp., Strain CCMP467" /LENGTH=92 /DNA_ID=CAMNT_0008824241 /DNA_START=30 /DNA_END=305 /DNA_ORIENTATION=-
MPPTQQNIRITMEMMRRAKRSLKKRGQHPCSPEIDRAINALQAVQHRVSAAYKYVKDMDDCVSHYKELEKTRRKPSTLYFLSRYVDQKKHHK